MPLEKIYIVRHGFRPPWSVTPQGDYQCSLESPTGIAADPPLTAHGLAQAEELAAYLTTILRGGGEGEGDVDVDVDVYSSPYFRCLQTLRPWVTRGTTTTTMTTTTTTTTHPRRVRGLHGVSEWFGAAPFLHPRPASAAALREFFPWYDEDEDDAAAVSFSSSSSSSSIRPRPHGESYAQLVARVSETMRRLIRYYDDDNNNNNNNNNNNKNRHRSSSILICSHAAVIIVIGRVLTGRHTSAADMDKRDFGAFTCGLSVFSRAAKEEEDGGSGSDESGRRQGLGNWTCERDSDCSFLSGGEERGWSFSGDESFPGTESLSQGNQDEENNDIIEPKL